MAEHFRDFLVARAGGQVVGSAGIERYGPSALLRSLAVVPAYRGHGLGKALTERVLDAAGRQGVQRVLLLTTTAADFFPGFGFKRIHREEADRAVRDSAEFRTACCASAVCMRLETLEICRALWRRDGVSFSGQHFSLQDVTVEPKPHRPGGPPLWIGGSGPTALREAARLDAWFPLGPTVEFVAERWPGVQAAARAAGRAPGAVTAAAYVTLALDPSPTAAEHRLHRFLETHYAAPAHRTSSFASRAGTSLPRWTRRPHASCRASSPPDRPWYASAVAFPPGLTALGGILFPRRV